jgi:hypothetical protein
LVGATPLFAQAFHQRGGVGADGFIFGGRQRFKRSQLNIDGTQARRPLANSPQAPSQSSRHGLGAAIREQYERGVRAARPHAKLMNRLGIDRGRLRRQLEQARHGAQPHGQHQLRRLPQRHGGTQLRRPLAG